MYKADKSKSFLATGEERDQKTYLLGIFTLLHTHPPPKPILPPPPGGPEQPLWAATTTQDFLEHHLKPTGLGEIMFKVFSAQTLDSVIK